MSLSLYLQLAEVNTAIACRNIWPCYKWSMKILTGIGAQPNFPAEDLTDENASVLELLLGNSLVVQQGHDQAERHNWVFRIGHPTAVRSAQRLYDGSYIDAVEHGVAVFEAMNVAVVGMHAAQTDVFKVNSNAYDLLAGFSDGRLRNETIDALQQFMEDLPRTAEVIASTSRRYVGPLTDYALLGASIEQKMILDSITEIGSGDE